MNIGILGTGIVAQTLGSAIMAKGHTIVFGTRDVQSTLAKTEKGGMGALPFAEYLSTHPSGRLAGFAEAAAAGAVVLNATSGSGAMAALKSAGAEALRGKILIDISNPLDFSKGFPPFLSVSNTDSLGEEIQRAFPDVKVVKTLNTMTCMIMANPALVPGAHNVFMSGNDAIAKGSVAAHLQEWFGWKKEYIIDVGDITTARGTEMLLPLWVRLYGALKTPMFNFHVARA